MEHPPNQDLPDLPNGQRRVHPSPRPEIIGHSYLEEQPQAGTSLDVLLGAQEGYIVGRIGNHFLRLQTDAHLLTAAPTGEGKGIGYIIPNLLDHPGSAFVIDMRGETVAATANARRLMGQDIVVLDPYNVTDGRWGRDSFNPLDTLDPDNHYTFEANVVRLAEALMFDKDGRKSNEPIWDNVTKEMMVGAITFVMTGRPEEKRNLWEVVKLFIMDERELADFQRELAYVIAEQGDRVYYALKMYWANMTASREKTKIPDNAISQANSLLGWTGHRTFRDMTDHSTFSFADMQNEKMTVYLVIPEEHMGVAATWVRVLLESAIFSHKNTATPTRLLRQDKRSLFLIDEFPAFGKLEEIEKGTSTARGRGINLWLFVQSLSQLDKIYGEHGARAIINNTAMLQAFGSNDIKELEYYSQLIGEELFDVESVSLGVTETVGESEAQGQTFTVSNAFSTAYGTSTQKTRSEGQNWSKTSTEGHAISHGTGDSETTGVTNATGGSDGTNINRTSGSQAGSSYHYGSGGGGGGGSSGSSSSVSLGRSFARNWSRGLSTSKTRSRNQGMSRNYSTAQGGGGNVVFATAEGQSTTDTTTQSTAEGITTTKTKNTSTGHTRTVTIKPEQRRVETARSLRVKLGGTGQLLSLRGRHPCLVPRMNFVATYQDTGLPMFPLMKALTSIGRFDRLADDPLIAEPYDRLHEILGSEIALLPAAPLDTGFSPELAVQHRNVVRNFKTTYAKHRHGLDKQLRAIEDAAFLLHSLYGLFEEGLHIEGMDEAIHKASQPPEIEAPEFKVLEQLPIFAEEPDEQWEHNSGWLSTVYETPLSKATAIVRGDAENLKERAAQQERARGWVQDRLLDTAVRIDDLLADCADYEGQKRHQFVTAKYGY